ncbi:hypothetical protein HZA57_01275 [Candidatus Poribacteria bacterium]|nr:hypothetical protein [Candidatus Poribacteria bacterium]
MTQPAHPKPQPRRLLHLAEGCLSPRSAKTTRGVLLYSPHVSVGVLDSTNVGKTAHQLLGCGEGGPVRASVGDFLRDGS